MIVFFFNRTNQPINTIVLTRAASSKLLLYDISKQKSINNLT